MLDCEYYLAKNETVDTGYVPPELVFGEPPPAGIKEKELLGLTSTGTNVASLQMKKEARDSEQWLSSSILEGGLIGTEFNLNQSDSLLDLTSELTGQRKGQRTWS